MRRVVLHMIAFLCIMTTVAGGVFFALISRISPHDALSVSASQYVDDGPLVAKLLNTKDSTVRQDIIADIYATDLRGLDDDFIETEQLFANSESAR